MIDPRIIDRIEDFRQIRVSYLNAVIEHEIEEMKKGKPPTPGTISRDATGKSTIVSTWLENVSEEQLFTNIIIGKLIEYLQEAREDG